MIKTFKALSALLCYPSVELNEAIGEITFAFEHEHLLPCAQIVALRPLLNQLASDDIYDLQERYVMLFDRSRTLSLNLFEHIHGESRDRGGAMVDLIEMYRGAGFEPATSELPDHLPVLLEYLATRPFGEAQEVLADTAHILEALRTRLTRRGSDYAAVFAALLHLTDVQPDQEALAELLQEPLDDPEDLEALDAVWEEAQVTFGPDPNAGCPQVRDMLARMDQPINMPATAN